MFPVTRLPALLPLRGAALALATTTVQAAPTVSINGGDVLVTADGGLVKLTGGDVVSIGGTIKEN